MSELDYEAKRSGLSFSARVKLLASEAPDSFSSSTLHKAANCLDSHYGFSPRDKKKAIVSYMRKSGGTVSRSELKSYFRWHGDMITWLIGELVTDGAVEWYDADPAGLGPGRRARRIRFTDRQAAIITPQKVK